MTLDIRKLIKLLNLTMSPNDNECLAAIRKAREFHMSLLLNSKACVDRSVGETLTLWRTVFSGFIAENGVK